MPGRRDGGRVAAPALNRFADPVVIIEPSTIPGFTVATLAILVAPGPDMMFMIGTGFSAGRRGAAAAAFGVTTGVTIYVVGSAVGLAALLETVPELLNLIRLLGAAYLVVMARRAWQNDGSIPMYTPSGPGALGGIFRRGFVVNITNPKVAIFIAAFIPHFVRPDLGNTTAQFLVFAVAFQAFGLVMDLIVGMTAGSARRLFSDRPGVAATLDRLAAGVYMLIATWLMAEQFV